MLNKKAIQLSVNFLVVVILSIVMLGMGVWLLTQFFDFGVDIEQQISEKEEEAIEAALQQGELISIPIYTKTTQREELVLFGYGIYNVEDKSKFRIQAVSGIDESGTQVSSIDDWLRYDKETFILDKNEQKKDSIAVIPSETAARETYVFTFEVKRDVSDSSNIPDWQSYPFDNSVMKIYVKVR
ncbi:hypothetical protein GF336_06075 [Candidatus Woesearchaeota archaeon]|nr:hypothetical protein [Candidatus Woesearchaeota archaeon]